jgi:PKD repeat protein
MMNFRLLTCLLLLGTLLTNIRQSALAQSSPEPVFHCPSDLESALQHPENRSAFEALEAQIEQHIQLQANRMNKTSELPYPTASKYVIPVVVNVVHGGRALNAGQDSISREQVESAFQLLFQDFRRVPGTRSYGSGVDTQIEFCLATKDPDGKDHSGINYIFNPRYTNMPYNLGDPANDSLKRIVAPGWDRSKYFNVWLVRNIVTQGNDGEIKGFAQFPFVNGMGSTPSNAATDGVVICNDSWGAFSGRNSTSQNYSGVASHEVGHWLNLFHPFQPSPSNCHPNTRCANDGDRVCDTPPVASGVHKNATVRINSCSQDSPDMPDDPMFYMDYTGTLTEMNSFSPGQTQRMQAVLENPELERRYNLWQEANLEATGTGKYAPPTAYFWADKRQACVGSSVKFLDYSKGQPSKFQWRFEGGTPATSTDAVPVVTYNTPGRYSVTLIVGNENPEGKTDTFTQQSFIEVIDTVFTFPFHESFDVRASPPNGWMIENEDAAVVRNSWTRTSSSYDTLSGSFVMNMSGYPYYNQLDALITPNIKLPEKATNVGFSFRYAYAPMLYEQATAEANGRFQRAIRTIYADTLTVYVSNDCGATWKTVWRKGGNDLNTAKDRYISNSNGQGGIFDKPTKEEWKLSALPLQDMLNQTIRIKFETKNRFGNRLFIDSVRVEEGVTSRGPKLNLQQLISIYPNPFHGQTEYRLELAQPAEVELSLMNINGQVLWHQPLQSFTPGQNTVVLPLNGQPAGVYLLRSRVNDQIHMSKLLHY